jgi:FKBP-type peptidyl-prolyl cis-trans isomerase (trigger factor)
MDVEVKSRLIKDEIVERFRGDINSQYFKVALNETTEKFFARLEADNMTVEEYYEQNKIDEKRLRKALSCLAYDGLKEDMALDSLFRHHSLKCTDDDTRAVLIHLSPDNPEAVHTRLQKACLTHQIRQATERQCARRWLMETAQCVK